MINGNKNNIITIVLFIGLFTLAFMWFGERKQNVRYQFQQLIDFHSNLIDLGGALDNISKLIATVDIDNFSDQEYRIFSLALKNQLTELEQTIDHIRTIEARVDPKKEYFSKDFSIEGLMSVIRQIEDVTRDILKEKQIDKEKTNKLKEVLSNTFIERNELLYNTSTDKLDSQEFKNRLEKLINTMEAELRKIQMP